MKKRDLAGSESLTSASFFQNGVAAVASSFHDEEDSQGQLIEKTQKPTFKQPIIIAKNVTLTN